MGRLMKSLYKTGNKNIWLRELKTKDAPLMLEWMHTEDLVCNLNKNFLSKTLADCKHFIENSLTDRANLHLAIVDSSDTYLGTVSLKDIDAGKGNAEFAIVLRSAAIGKGVSCAAMEEMLHIGFEEFHLGRIYWCVVANNLRAVRFYDKNGYVRVPCNKNVYANPAMDGYLWYEAKNNGS